MSIMTQITNSMLIIKASTFTLKIYVACSLLNYLYHYAIDSVKLGSISKPVHVVVNFDSEFILSLL